MKAFTTLLSTLLLGVIAGQASASLVITEVMSNSDHPGGAANGDWWELTNNGSTAVDLTGYYWDDGNGFNDDGAVFPAISIAAGESIVIVDEGADNLATFVADWGGGFTAISKDDFSGDNDFSSLSSGGDQVDLYDTVGNLVASAVFGDSDDGGKSFAWDIDGSSLGFSQDGVYGAYTAIGDGAGGTGTDVGSPGFAYSANVPEPSTLLLVGLTLAGAAVVRRRVA